MRLVCLMLALVAVSAAREYDSPSEWTKPLADGTCREGRELREMDCLFDRSHSCFKYFGGDQLFRWKETVDCTLACTGCVCHDIEMYDGKCGDYESCQAHKRLFDLYDFEFYNSKCSQDAKNEACWVRKKVLDTTAVERIP